MAHRARGKAVTGVGTNIVTSYPAGIGYVSPPSLFTNQYLSEEILWDGFPRPQFNRCSHKVVRDEVKGPDLYWRWTERGYDLYKETINHPTQVVRLRFAPEPTFAIDWGQAITNLLRDASGVQSPSTTFLQNIAELTQLKTLLPSIVKGCNSLLKLILTKGNARHYIYNVASGHLAYTFGAKPIFRDLASLFELTESLSKQRRWLETLAHGGMTTKGTRVRAAAPSISIKTEEAVPDVYNQAGNGVFTANTDKVSVKVTAGVSATAFARLLPANIANYKLLVNTLGLNNPLGVAWELLPLSFVVDWFVPVSRIIDRIPLDVAMGSVMESIMLTNWSHYYKVVVDHDATLNRFVVLDPRSLPGFLYSTPGYRRRNTSLYVRERGRPTWTMPTHFSKWTLSQSLLSLSLLAQRLTSGQKKPAGSPARLPEPLWSIFNRREKRVLKY